MKKRVLVIASFPPPIHGASYINKLIVESGALRDRFLIDTLPLKFETKLKNLGRPTLMKLCVFFVTWLRLVIKLFDNRYDLICYTPAPLKLVFIRDYIYLSTIKLFRKNLVVHFQTAGYEKFIRFASYRAAMLYLLSGTSTILHSPLMHDRMPSLLKNSRPYYIPNTVSAYLSEEEVLDALSKRENRDGLRILFISNMYTSKGPFILLEALAKIIQTVPNTTCHIAGSFPSGKDFALFRRAIKRMGLSSHVHYTGQASRIQKKELLLDADIFVFPSYYYWESCPVVILEAMQAGLPVVSFDIGIARELIENGTTGYVTPKNDPAFLADTIRAIARDKKRLSQMGRGARERFLKNYTVSHFENKLREAFEDALRRGEAHEEC